MLQDGVKACSNEGGILPHGAAYSNDHTAELKLRELSPLA